MKEVLFFFGVPVWVGPHLQITYYEQSHVPESFVRLGLVRVLDECAPNLIHLFEFSVYRSLLVEVARARGIPIVVTPLDFGWFCSRSTLVCGGGQLCPGQPSSALCTNCLSSGRDFITRVARKAGAILPSQMSGVPGIGAVVREVQSKQHQLRQTLADWPKYREGVQHWIAPSQAMESALRVHGIAPDKITRVPYGYNAPAVAPSKATACPVVFGYAGRTIFEKGFHLLVDAFERLVRSGVDCRLRLFGVDPNGRGKYPRDCMAKIKRVLGRVEFASYDIANASSVHDAHRGIHAMVVPSIWLDNLPQVVTESLAHGTPVIASAHSSAAEPLIDGQNGLTFDAFSPDGLYQAMARFAADGDLRQRLFAGARYSISSRDEANNVLKVYRRVLERTPTTADKLRND